MPSSRPGPTSPPRLALALWLTTALCACGGTASPAAETAGAGTASPGEPGDSTRDPARGLPRSRFDNLPTSGLELATFDINQDGRDDQTHYRSGGELVRIERDLNFDGRVDAWEHYQGGQIAEEEVDLDLDGTIDVVRTYQGGIVTTKRYAVGFRADLATLRSYDPQGNLVQVERDTDRDGRTDTWEHYQPGVGQPVRVETDRNRDGQPDPSPGGNGT